MQLRHLETVTLKRVTKTKQSNGSYIDTTALVNTFYCQFKELDDDVSASIYGAKLDKMYRISSVRQELETYLMNKLGEVSDYKIYYESRIYKIVSIKKHWVDIEMVGNE